MFFCYMDFNCFSFSISIIISISLKVSHTTDDMIFQWDPDVPLVVDDNIELPQLALVKNHTADCKRNSFFFVPSANALT